MTHVSNFIFQEFDWVTFAYNVLSEFGTEDLAKVIDSKFSVISKLTYRNIGKYKFYPTKKDKKCQVSANRGIGPKIGQI